MSKQNNYMIFQDEKGMLFAVRKDYCSLEAAKDMALDKLKCESVKQSNDYKYMYFGFGKAVGMDEYENTWWLTGEKIGKFVEVYVFREDWKE